MKDAVPQNGAPSPPILISTVDESSIPASFCYVFVSKVIISTLIYLLELPVLQQLTSKVACKLQKKGVVIL